MNNQFPPPFVSQSADAFDPHKMQMPGGILTLSANQEKDGILWASRPTDKDANIATVAGTLRAFNADNLQEELWNSDHDPTGADAVGNLSKFCPPVAANGKVYMATFSNSLVVYGLLGDTPPTPLGPWSQASIGTGVLGSGTESCDRFNVLGAGRDIWDTADAFHFVYQMATTGHSITLTARVLGVQDTDPWAKAGLMVRETLDPNSANVLLAQTPGNGVTFQQRLTTGSNTTAAYVTGYHAPRWLRLTVTPVTGRAGQYSINGQHSNDGNTWQQVGTAIVLSVGGILLAGLAVCSHTVTSSDPQDVGLEELNLSSFDQVRLT